MTPTRVRATQTAQPPYVEFVELGFSRTARRLMTGVAYVPREPPVPDMTSLSGEPERCCR